MSIVNITSTVGKRNLFALARPLTREDVDFEFLAPSDNVVHCYGSIDFKIKASIKVDVLKEIIEATKPETYSNGDLPNDSPFRQIMEKAGEEPKVKTIYHDYATKDFSTRGMRKNVQQKKYDEALAELLSQAEQLKDSAIDKAVELFQESINDLIEINNNSFKRTIRMLVVDGNVSDDWLNKNLSEKEQTVISEAEQEVALMQAQIEKLQAQVKAARNAQYKVKRNCVEVKLKASMCDEGKAIVDSLAGEVKEEDHFFSFS